MKSRISIFNITATLLLLLSLQFHCSWGASTRQWGIARQSANPLLGVFNRYPQQRQQQSRREPSNFHDVLLCNNNDCDDEDDDLAQVSTLALSSSIEQRFFRQAESALLSADDDNNARTPSVVDCSSTSSVAHRPLVFWENMVCGAISRSIAQTVMHPANTMKTILQSSRAATPPTITSLMRPSQFHRLSMGAGANFILSVPHGAINFAVLEFVRAQMATFADKVGIGEQFGPAMDFCSSCISTICCSIVSTPQMMITDNIMAGNYPNLPAATRGLYQNEGIKGFYSGWFPGLAGKIPSYVSLLYY